MTGGVIFRPVYSVFTMGLLEDSGWYKPNYDLADELTFGYKQGCDFIYQNCKGTK